MEGGSSAPPSNHSKLIVFIRSIRQIRILFLLLLLVVVVGRLRLRDSDSGVRTDELQLPSVTCSSAQEPMPLKTIGVSVPLDAVTVNGPAAPDVVSVTWAFPAASVNPDVTFNAPPPVVDQAMETPATGLPN